jgi:CRISPR/Cas system-associated endoribonuclease Cas2
MGYYDRHYHVWINSYSVFECRITHKIVRTLHRECKRYTNKRQTDLITNEPMGKRLNKTGKLP